MQVLPQPRLNFCGAIAPALELKPFFVQARAQGWQVKSQQPQTVVLIQDERTLTLPQERYREFFQGADIAIAMAGTATEEFVGLGKPAIIMPGEGPQFTYAFAEAQSRLLGCSIIMVDKANEVSQAISQVINNPQQLQQIAANGKRRMGESGAAQRIALSLCKTLLKEQ